MKTSSMIVALALVAGLAGCGMTGQANTDLEEIRVFVHVEPVRQGTLDRTLELTATVQAGRAVDLLPDMPGKVSSLPVKVGQEVRKGDVLARLDMEMAELQQRQASAAAKLAVLGLETATREFARAEPTRCSSRRRRGWRWPSCRSPRPAPPRAWRGSRSPGACWWRPSTG
ncbi:MAG: biotin/lipoyl-binding protein [Deltaproteobacteria bacterium]|nr:biotin/lipoyl-binding protein [Deltaproteobacteria bacterium]